ncbi:MAG TPA: hypothetical protein VKZ97_02295 [Flavobacteriaceae bacterium]|nr:hypothetical protein [Flavobacteriaceae bacterium]
MKYLFKRLTEKRSWNKLFKQRLTEPFHLNFLALFVYFFGSFKKKVAYDLVIRPQYAHGILSAAEYAKEQGFKTITVIEFGVANGGGLMNMIAIAEKVTKSTGIKVNIYGFDTGKGMPAPTDFRDHPEYYNTGDFPMNKALLEANIKGKATILYGNIKDSLIKFIETLDTESPIGFVSVDVDYYSSTKEVLDLFKANPEYFLPLTNVYFDDIFMPHHNEKCGELLAIKEFNHEMPLRQLEHHYFFVNQRIFKNANWIKQFYYLHVLDHNYRREILRERTQYVLDNPYLKFEGNKKQF